MKQARFTPQEWERDILARCRRIFGALVLALPEQRSLNRMRAMLRVGEALARRILLVMAMMAPPLKPIAARVMSPAARQAVRAPSQAPPRLGLIETFAWCGLYPGAQRHAKAPPVETIHLPSLGLARHFVRPPSPTSPLNSKMVRAWRNAAERAEALIDVAARTEHHVMRLRRWIARQDGRRAAGSFARTSPLRPGRPRALKRFDGLNPTRHAPDEMQDALWNVTQLIESLPPPLDTS